MGTQKGAKQLQFYGKFGKLMKSEGLAVLISGVYGECWFKYRVAGVIQLCGDK